MWLTFLLKYWKLAAISVTALISVVIVYTMVKKHNEAIRKDERAIVNAEWQLKENERLEAQKQIISNAQKSKDVNIKKARTLAPAAVIGELDAGGWLRAD